MRSSARAAPRNCTRAHARFDDDGSISTTPFIESCVQKAPADSGYRMCDERQVATLTRTAEPSAVLILWGRLVEVATCCCFCLRSEMDTHSCKLGSRTAAYV